MTLNFNTGIISFLMSTAFKWKGILMGEYEGELGRWGGGGGQVGGEAYVGHLIFLRNFWSKSPKIWV